MNTPRLLVYLVGLVLALAAVWMLFFQAGINRWIPVSIFALVLLLLVGLGVMSASNRAGDDRTETRVVEERRYD